MFGTLGGFRDVNEVRKGRALAKVTPPQTRLHHNTCIRGNRLHGLTLVLEGCACPSLFSPCGSLASSAEQGIVAHPSTPSTQAQRQTRANAKPGNAEGLVAVRRKDTNEKIHASSRCVLSCILVCLCGRLRVLRSYLPKLKSHRAESIRYAVCIFGAYDVEHTNRRC